MKNQAVHIEENLKNEIVTKPNGMGSYKEQKNNFVSNIKFLLAGIFFGIVLIKSEVISWFRIQEMFRLESFHMFGVMGTAIATGMLSLFVIKRFKIKTINKQPILLSPKKFQKGNIYGGLLFGFGWALTGACPGPLFAQVGSGATVVLVTILCAIAGTWVYGLNRDKLPH